MRIMVTGGAGFIGSVLVRHLIGHSGHEVLVIDKLTYAGSLTSLVPVQDSSRYSFSQTDILRPTGYCQNIFGVRSRCGDAPGCRKSRRQINRQSSGFH